MISQEPINNATRGKVLNFLEMSMVSDGVAAICLTVGFDISHPFLYTEESTVGGRRVGN